MRPLSIFACLVLEHKGKNRFSALTGNSDWTGSWGDLGGVWHLALPFDEYFRKFWYPHLQWFQRSTDNCGKIHVRIILGHPILQLVCPQGHRTGRQGLWSLFNVLVCPQGHRTGRQGLWSLFSVHCTCLPSGAPYGMAGSVEFVQCTCLPSGAPYGTAGSVEFVQCTCLPSGAPFDDGGYERSTCYISNKKATPDGTEDLVNTTHHIHFNSICMPGELCSRDHCKQLANIKFT